MIKEGRFRIENSNYLYLKWLNDNSAREDNDYMLIVTNLIDYNRYPVYCKKDNLSDVQTEYDNRHNNSRIDTIIELQSKKEQENTVKTYFKSIADKERIYKEYILRQQSMRIKNALSDKGMGK